MIINIYAYVFKNLDIKHNKTKLKFCKHDIKQVGRPTIQAIK